MSNGKEKKEPTIADVLARLDTMEAKNKKLESENESLRRSTMQLMATPLPATTSPVASTPAKDTLPDPTEDPKGYAEAVRANAEREARAALEAERAKDRNEVSAKQRTAQMFEDFARKYPEIAKYKGRVEYIAGELVKKAIARGMDGQKYVFGAQDMFFDDVAKAYNDEFGVPAKDTVTDGDDGKDDDPDEGRTGGIPGGLESGHTLSSGKKDPKPEGPSGMIKELQDIQLKTGFF
jgi:hypothetical protein